MIYDIKRIAGRAIDDPEFKQFNDTHLFKIEDNNQYIWIPNLGETVLFEQILSLILSHLVDICSTELNIPYLDLNEVVVSIPALFHNGQRKAIRSSCHLANLNPSLLVIEPTAASLAHSYSNVIPSKELKFFITFDFGGGTLDCSVMRCTGLECEVLSVTGNSSLGGINFDNIIKDIIIDKFRIEHSWFGQMKMILQNHNYQNIT